MDVSRDRERASQTVRTLMAMRELLLAGEWKAGERLSELAIVERLGVSRTPVRSALAHLEAEGFLEINPTGGYAVKKLSEREAVEAIEIRGALEGLAARFAAERGLSSAELQPIKRCLADIDRLIETSKGAENFDQYVGLNRTFHDLLAGLAGSRNMVRQIERAAAHPFASPSGFVIAQTIMPSALNIIIVAQDHHRCIVDAIENREGARAEALAREHARLAARNLAVALTDQKAMHLVPGAALIRADA